jgi:hypothetical protein
MSKNVMAVTLGQAPCKWGCVTTCNTTISHGQNGKNFLTFCQDIGPKGVEKPQDSTLKTIARLVLVDFS